VWDKRAICQARLPVLARPAWRTSGVPQSPSTTAQAREAEMAKRAPRGGKYDEIDPGERSFFKYVLENNGNLCKDYFLTAIAPLATTIRLLKLN
jgi:hypothetical protein